MAGVKAKKKILMVDDDVIQLEIAQAILQNTYEVYTAKSGQEALAHFFKGLSPDLILLDIVMPNMDGWETFNRIRAISLLKDVPIAFLTSVDGAAAEKHALEMGAADFITKPYKKSELLNRLKHLIS